MLLFFLLTSLVKSQNLLISEIADKGGGDVCGGEDWFELHNSGSASMDFSSWKIHDDKGPDDDGAFQFPSPSILEAGEFLLVCCNRDDDTGPSFKIGGDDTIFLLDSSDSQVSSFALLDAGDDGLSYSRDSEGTMVQSSTLTPGSSNTITTPVELDVIAYKAGLTAQNELGTSFFGMTTSGAHLDGTVDVVELRVTMAEVSEPRATE